MSNDKSPTTIQAKEAEPLLIKRIEKKFGPVDMKNDFFSKDLSMYFKTTDIDKETGRISHKPIKLASFSDSLTKLHTALNALKQLSKTPEGKSDEEISVLANSIRDIFNKYRTHLRNNYPDQYQSIKTLLEEINTTGGGSGASSFTAGEGAQYATPFAFSKKGQNKKNKFYYKLGYKKAPIKEEEKLSKLQSFHKERISAFDNIETELNSIIVQLSNLKNETVQYYNDNPTSFDVVKPTDLVMDYIKDIKKLLTQDE